MARRRHPWLRRIGIACLAGALAFGALLWRSHDEVHHLGRAELRITTTKLDAPVRVLQVTDVHNAPPDVQAQLLDRVRETRPDLVAMTGDLVSTFTKDFANTDRFVTELVAIGSPVFFVEGNHEVWNPREQAVLDLLTRHGVQILHNEHRSLDGDWGRLELLGTGDYYDQQGDLAAAQQGTRPGAFQLVLTHDPGIVPDLDGSGADLAICGHTHGGQVRLPVIGALYAPGQGFLPSYDMGLFQVGGSQLYIDRGAGASVPLRLNARAQTTLLTIGPS